MRSRRRVLIDACAFIALIQNKPDMERLDELLGLIDSGRVELVESVIVLGEVFRPPLSRDKNQAEEERVRLQVIRNRLRSRDVTLVDVTKPIVDKATEYRLSNAAKKLPDAIHLATAVLNKCDWFITLDHGFQDVDGVTIIREEHLQDRTTALPWEDQAPAAARQEALFEDDDAAGDQPSQ